MITWLKKILPSSRNVPNKFVTARESVLHKSRGDVFLDAEQWSDAAACYRQAITQNPNDAAAALNLGFVLNELGLYREAQKYLLQAIALDPGMADALYILGGMAQEQGDFVDAISYYGRALEIKPEFEIIYGNLCHALFQSARFDEAADVAKRGIVLNPRNANFHHALGNLHMRESAFDEAIQCFQVVLSLQPGNAQVHNQVGLALHAQGKLDQALEHFQAALLHTPVDANVFSNRGLVLHAQGKMEAAIGSFQQALILSPDFAEAHNNLGLVYQALGKMEVAIACHQKALTAKPDLASAHNNMGNALQAQGKLDAAIASYCRALEINPDFAKAYLNLGSVHRTQGAHKEALELYQKSLSFDPDSVVAHNNYLYTLQYIVGIPSEKLLAEHAYFAKIFEEPLRTQWRGHSNVPNPQKRLKIGYVSGDFRRHAVATFMEPILACHDKASVELYCYFNSVEHDDISVRIQSIADHWIPCAGLNDEQLATRIRSDEVDILIDLSGHTSGNRLLVFARRPTPVQLTYLGYPGTSGLSAMDYRITDSHADGDGSEQYYTEKLLRLPHSTWCYSPRADMPEVSLLPALKNGFLTFGSFNNFNKLDQQCIELWAELLRALPTSRLIMVTIPEGADRLKFAQRFAALGIGGDRLDFFGKLSSVEFHRMFQQVDVALDPLNVNGATTSCESLWMGVPFITVTGARFLSRAGLSILSAAGMQEFAAESSEHFIKIAVDLSADLPRLARRRACMRAHLIDSPLMDIEMFTRNLEQRYREIWSQWCATNNV